MADKQHTTEERETPMKAITRSITDWIKISRCQRALFFIPVVLACFALPTGAQAVSPPPDGGYAEGNTAEGDDALLSLTSGLYNTAIGFISLESDTEGNLNTAVGAGTLLVNTAGENTAIGAGALLSNTTGIGN